MDRKVVKLDRGDRSFEAGMMFELGIGPGGLSGYVVRGCYEWRNECLPAVEKYASEVST